MLITETFFKIIFTFKALCGAHRIQQCYKLTTVGFNISQQTLSRRIVLFMYIRLNTTID